MLDYNTYKFEEKFQYMNPDWEFFDTNIFVFRQIIILNIKRSI